MTTEGKRRGCCRIPLRNLGCRKKNYVSWRFTVVLLRLNLVRTKSTKLLSGLFVMQCTRLKSFIFHFFFHGDISWTAPFVFVYPSPAAAPTGCTTRANSWPEERATRTRSSESKLCVQEKFPVTGKNVLKFENLGKKIVYIILRPPK